jgi:hypothetical protein
MAVTISGTQVTFNDSTVQSTEATLLGAVQYTAYSNTYRYGQQGFSTSEVDQQHSWGDVVTATTSPTTTVYCGVRGYRVGTSTSGDSSTDGGTIYSRILYRSVGGA